MAEIQYLADINLTKNQLKDARLHNFPGNVDTPAEGQIWFDTIADRVTVQTLPSGTTIKQVAWVGDAMTPATHGHPIGEITGLQSELDAKEPTILLAYNKAVVSTGAGKLTTSVTSADEIGYLTGLDGNIMTLLGSKVSNSLLGVANGVATLDGTGKVPSSQLPGSVDDVIEAANFAALNALSAAEKTSNRIYVALDTNITYRWSGSTFIEISSTIACAATTGVIGGTGSDTASTASRSDHKHAIADNAITTNMINGAAVTGAKIADNAVTLAKMADGSVGTSELIANNVTNAKLAKMTAKTIKGNITTGSADPTDVAMTDLATMILDGSTTVSKVTRVLQTAAINSSGTTGAYIAVWDIVPSVTRPTSSKYMASVDIFKQTGERVFPAISINQTSGKVTATFNTTILSGSIAIAANTYMAIITE